MSMYTSKSSRGPDQPNGGRIRIFVDSDTIDPDTNNDNEPLGTTSLLDGGRMPLADRTAEFIRKSSKRAKVTLPREIRRAIAQVG